MDFFQNVSNVSVSMIIDYIRAFGILAPLVAFLFFMVQAALPVFPYVILAAAGGLLFGFKMGFLLSWLGALVGACLAYWICKLVGGEWAAQKIKERWGYDVKQVNGEMAFWSIVIARIVPVVPTPIINVAAALGGVPFWNFFFSSAIGKIPTAVLYTGLGVCLFQTHDIKLTLSIIAAIIALVAVGRYMTKKGRFKLQSSSSSPRSSNSK
ncbi:MAG: TVP38/TMEM64 family protein [Syntrophomonadaceae bacterium]|nr:TVP38/TMEM64 family protein [Syntrophomonadaceae bacterium]